MSPRRPTPPPGAPTARRNDHGTARAALLAAVVFVLGGAVIGSAVWLGWGSAPRPPPEGRQVGATVPSLPPPTSTTLPPRVVDALSGVWCGRGDACIAVGNSSKALVSHPFSEVRTETGWNVAPIAPAGGSSARLSAISCVGTTPTWCVTVGSVTAPGEHAFAEIFDGTSWTSSPVPRPGTFDDLVGVGCESKARCVAVGSYRDARGVFPLLEELSGSTWSLMRSPAVSGAQVGAVSCGASCVVVGDLLEGHRIVPFSEELTASGWRVTPVPLPAGARTGAALSSVDCVPHGWCTAVGVQYGTRGTPSPLIEQQGPHGWSRVAVRAPASGAVSATSFGVTGMLSGVSCPSRGLCTAVGERVGGNWASAPLVPFIVSQSAGSWFLAGRPPVDSSAARFSGISCVLGSPCVAVGSLFKGGQYRPLVAFVGTGVASLVPPG